MRDLTKSEVMAFRAEMRRVSRLALRIARKMR